MSARGWRIVREGFFVVMMAVWVIAIIQLVRDDGLGSWWLACLLTWPVWRLVDYVARAAERRLSPAKPDSPEI